MTQELRAKALLDAEDAVTRAVALRDSLVKDVYEGRRVLAVVGPSISKFIVVHVEGPVLYLKKEGDASPKNTSLKRGFRNVTVED